jgi:RNA polymerase sigma factor (sigma-70 family)
MTGVLSVPGPRRIVGQGSSDHDLVARVRQGDDRAFELLFDRYRERITAYVRGMVHDHGRAEDITQEVFINALRRMRETDRSIAFRPWIYEIAKNACIDAHRRARRTQEVSYDRDEPLAAADQGRLVSPRFVSDTVEARESLENVKGALGALSESHADVLVLRELEGLSYAEIGERLGMSRASVESTLFRARKRLEAEYADLVSGERCRQVQALFEGGARPRLRDKRQIDRHLAWCQACRHEARLAGVEVEVGRRVPLRTKIGGLLPIPAFIRERLVHLAPGLGDPLMEWGRAAVGAAAIAIAGVGAGAAIHGGPIVDAYGYSGTPGLYGGGGEGAQPPGLSKVSALIGSERGLMRGAPLPGVPGGSGPLGAPVSAGPLVGGGAVGGVGLGSATGGGALPGLGAGTGTTASAGGVVGAAVQGTTGAVGGAVGGLTNTVGGTVQGAAGTVDNTVRGVGGTAGGTVQGAAGTVNNAVRGVTGTADGVVRDVTRDPADVGGAVDGAVQGTTRTVTDTVRGTTETVRGTVGGTTDTVRETVQGTTQTVQSTVSGTTDTVRQTVQSTTQTVQGTVGALTQPRQTTSTPAPAPAPTPTQTQAAPAPSAPSQTPVQDVVQQTTSTLGGILGG